MNAYDEWMVRSNLARIADGEMTADANVALLRANGYGNVADAVEAAVANACVIHRVIDRETFCATHHRDGEICHEEGLV